MVASQYPFLSAIWTMFVFFAWIIWIWFLVTVFGDLFKRSDIGGWHKALWTVFILFLPFIGAISYLIGQGRAMEERRMQRAQAAQSDLDDYVREVAGTKTKTNGVGEISEAKQLLDTGAITLAEFEVIKSKALASN